MTNFLKQVDQKFGNFLGYFENVYFYYKLLFGQLLQNIGLLFVLASGHTYRNVNNRCVHFRHVEVGLVERGQL